MPHGRKLVGYMWVFTEKDAATNRFSQVPGKYFTDSHAPVVTDLAFRLAFIITVLKKFCTGQINIKTAFLYSELDK
jgi:hypothetical protein